MGPFSGLEFETLSAVPRGPAAGRNGKPWRFGARIQVIQFNFIIVAIGSCTEICFSQPHSYHGLGRLESRDPLSNLGIEMSGHVKEHFIEPTRRLLLQAGFEAIQQLVFL